MDMQKREIKALFISDLDGTLLNRDAELSDFSVNILNRFIETGNHFTIATARTAATVEDIMSRVNLQLPVVLINGAAIYDMKKKEYVHFEKVDGHIIEDTSTIIERIGTSAFAYAIRNNKIVNYRIGKMSKQAKDFYIERINRYKKVFVKVQSLTEIAYDNIIYLSVIDTRKVIDSLYTALKDMEGINIVTYNDTYDSKTWYLEIFSETASKYHAAMFLKEKYDFTYLTCFGDNLNDISLFSACDEKYAPKNARDEIKKLATGIIGTNEEDCVAKWIMKKFPKTLDFNEII